MQDGAGAMVEQAEEPRQLVQYCSGLIETKQSWALQDHGYMIWAPEENEIPRTSREYDQVPAKARTTSSRTLVWWDMETCPAPATECSAWDDIANHLVRVLLLPNTPPHEFVTFIAYGADEVPDSLLFALKKCGIVVHRRNLPTCTVPGAGVTLGMKSMIVDILFWALNNGPPAEVRIISATTESNFVKLIRGLHRRSYNVLLASSIATSLDVHPVVLANGECLKSSYFTYYWHSLWKQIPEPDQPCSLEQLQRLHNSPCPGGDAAAGWAADNEALQHEEWVSTLFHDSPPRPSYKEIAARGEPTTNLSAAVTLRTPAAATTGSSGQAGISKASMADVRLWLQSFVAPEESLYGMNISLLAKCFEREGLKLDLKHLGCSSLSRLLIDRFGEIVRLKYPSKDCTVMFPAKLSAQAASKLLADFKILLNELLPHRDSESPLSVLKTAFKSRFQYELEHEAAGYIKLNHFVASMPKLVRVRHSSSLGKELVIYRPSVYYQNNQHRQHTN